MQKEKLAWLLAQIDRCEETRLTCKMTLSFFEGNMHPELEQTVKIVKQKS